MDYEVGKIIEATGLRLCGLSGCLHIKKIKLLLIIKKFSRIRSSINCKLGKDRNA